MPPACRSLSTRTRPEGLAPPCIASSSFKDVLARTRDVEAESRNSLCRAFAVWELPAAERPERPHSSRAELHSWASQQEIREPRLPVPPVSTCKPAVPTSGPLP